MVAAPIVLAPTGVAGPKRTGLAGAGRGCATGAATWEVGSGLFVVYGSNEGPEPSWNSLHLARLSPCVSTVTRRPSASRRGVKAGRRVAGPRLEGPPLGGSAIRRNAGTHRWEMKLFCAGRHDQHSDASDGVDATSEVMATAGHAQHAARSSRRSATDAPRADSRQPLERARPERRATGREGNVPGYSKTGSNEKIGLCESKPDQGEK